MNVDHQAEQLNSKAKLPKLIKPWKARKMLEHYLGGATATEEEIVNKIRAGEIKAYAKRSWKSKEPRLKKAWQIGPPDDAERDQQIRASIFIGSENWDRDAKQWKWQRGDFFISSRKKNHRWLFSSVKFANEDIERLLADSKKVFAERHKGGRTLNEDNWTKIWLEVVQLALDGELTKQKMQYKGTLIQAVMGKFDDSNPAPLSDSAIKTAMKQVYDRFVLDNKKTEDS